MIQELNEPSGASGGYPLIVPTPPHYATARERAISKRFLRVLVVEPGRSYRVCLVETNGPDLNFSMLHDTQKEAEFCCYALARAITFCAEFTDG